MKRLPRVRICLAVMLLSSLWRGVPAFAAGQASEYAVRAALVFNFMKFTEWPANAFPDAKLKLCIASSDPEQRQAMLAVEDRRVRDVPIDAALYRPDVDCDLIYVDSRQRWKAMPSLAERSHILTIGGYEGFLEDGGMVEIALLPQGPRFDISLSAARRAGLRFYPQLLRLARRVAD